MIHPQKNFVKIHHDIDYAVFDTLLLEQQVTMTYVNNVHVFPGISLFIRINTASPDFYLRESHIQNTE